MKDKDVERHAVDPVYKSLGVLRYYVNGAGLRGHEVATQLLAGAGPLQNSGNAAMAAESVRKN